jgi:hypothetical protein
MDKVIASVLKWVRENINKQTQIKKKQTKVYWIC